MKLTVKGTSWESGFNRMNFRFDNGSHTFGWPVGNCFALSPEATQAQADAIKEYLAELDASHTKAGVLNALYKLLGGAPKGRVSESLEITIEGIQSGVADWKEWEWLIGWEADDAKRTGGQ